MLIQKTVNTIHEGTVGDVKIVVSVAESGEASGTFSKQLTQEGGQSYEQPIGSLNIGEVNKSISFHHQATVHDFAAAMALASKVVDLIISEANED